MVYRVTSRQQEKPVAVARTGLVFYDYHKQKVAPVPDAFRALIQS